MSLQKYLIGLCASFACSAVFAGTLLSEGFDDVNTLAAKGWVRTNNSAPVGTAWFQGNTGIFNAVSGVADSYIAASYTSAGFGGAVSNWLITPQLSLANGVTMDFALRLLGEGFTDTVEVYLSTNGASANVGTTTSSTGDFTRLLQTFQSDVDTGWTMQSIMLSGLSSPASGRLAFRYVVADNSTAGDYVGIDSVNVVPEPGTLALAALAFAALAWQRRSRRRISAIDTAAIL